MRVAPFLVVCRFVERVKYTGMKKTLRVFLLFAALLSWGAISQVQGAPFSGGDGSKASPFLIATLDDLKYLSEHAEYWESGYCFKQIADIDASDTRSWNVRGGEAQGFKPIGTFDQRFKGYYDGWNHAIRGLYINRPKQDGVGLFGVCENDESYAVSLKDLRVEDATVIGGRFVGGLAGSWIGTSKISNCHVTVQSVAGEEEVGGFVGWIRYSEGVSGCSATPVAAESSVRGLRDVGGGCRYIDIFAHFAVLQLAAGGRYPRGYSLGRFCGACGWIWLVRSKVSNRGLLLAWQRGDRRRYARGCGWLRGVCGRS